MAPRTESSRLATIEPADLARRCVAAQAEKINRIGESIGVRASLREDGQTERTVLGQKLVALAVYAQTGEGQSIAELRDLRNDVSRAFRTRLPDLDVVVDAADGRVRLATGVPLDANMIAALAGLSPQHVRLLIRKAGQKLPMPAKDAAKWLCDRSTAL